MQSARVAAGLLSEESRGAVYGARPSPDDPATGRKEEEVDWRDLHVAIAQFGVGHHEKLATVPAAGMGGGMGGGGGMAQAKQEVLAFGDGLSEIRRRERRQAVHRRGGATPTSASRRHTKALGKKQRSKRSTRAGGFRAAEEAAQSPGGARVAETPSR